MAEEQTTPTAAPEDEALDTRGRNITLGIFGAIVLLIVILVANNWRIKQDRIAGMKSPDPRLQAAKVREMMQGFTNNGYVAEQLQGERPSVRAAAVRSLRSLANEPGTPMETRKDAAKLTVPFLKDTDQPVKDLANQALTDMGPEVAIDAVTEALNDSDGTVKGGAQAVCQNFAGDAIAPILAFTGTNGAGARLKNAHRTYAGNALFEIQKKDPSFKTVIILGEEAVMARERHLTPEQAAADLQRFMKLKHPLLVKPGDRVYGTVDYLNPAIANEDDQNNAISILDRIGDTRAVPYLIPRLDAPQTRRAAVGALGRMADRRATDRLLYYLPRDETNRQEIVIALGKIADPKATAPLIQHGLASVSQPVRNAAADSLRNIGAPAVPQLIAALKSVDPNDPAYYKAEGAARALGGMKIPAATQAAVQALGHPSENVRLAAASSLGESADPSAIGPLIARFTDKSGAVAGAAARSVSAFAGKAVPQLVAALSQPAQVYWASTAIGYIGAPAMKALQQTVLTGDPAGARVAARLLGDLGDPAAITTLQQAVARRQDPDFRFEATGSIERLGGGAPAPAPASS